MNHCSTKGQINTSATDRSMTYCKFSEHSDIYLYANIFGGYHLRIDQEEQWQWFYCRSNILKKLEELILDGVKVPNDVISRLKTEIELNLPETIWVG